MRFPHFWQLHFACSSSSISVDSKEMPLKTQVLSLISSEIIEHNQLLDSWFLL